MSNREGPVLLVQLPIPPVGPGALRGNVPLAAGNLAMFARAHGHTVDLLPGGLTNRLGDRGVLEAICARQPSLLGFTCYMWNVDRVLWLARQVKQRLPDVQVVLGGPEITADNDWVLAEPSVDFAVFGEGERTFAELLDWRRTGDATTLPKILGLGFRRGERFVCNLPRPPMADLSALVSPYIGGVLDAGDEEQLLLETVRGCVFKCKFCYYPKAYDNQYYMASEQVLKQLQHARERAARDVYLLDPTLNQRPEFVPFLELLKRGNPDRSLSFFGELRGEGLNEKHAERMRDAGFTEVEIGLQSTDPHTQELMDRRNNLRAFERGVRAMRAVGIKVKVDLIVGLPGDTAESVRRSMHWVADNDLCDDAQVFQLSILPGTAFRREAQQLGLDFQERPPYYVLETPTMDLDTMQGLLAEAEEIFGVEFDALPPPAVGGVGATGHVIENGVVTVLRHDLDAASAAPAPTAPVAQSVSLWLCSRDPYATLARATELVRAHLADNPFSTLQVVLQTAEEFPLDVLDALAEACAPQVRLYLDRFYEFAPGAPAAARRLVVALPDAAKEALDDDWIETVLQQADVVWLGADGAAAALEPTCRAGEWVA
ncbi:MAG: B12-binding domain-containing radical SAM protein [Planctomycetes bacterium]|nr:B12-binding domain-containing radical SAM protein [Planctomycetota bacterium]